MTQAGASYMAYHELSAVDAAAPAVGAGAVAGTMMRTSSRAGKVAPTFAASPEITAGNEPADQIVTGYEGGPSLDFPLTAKNWDSWIAALLRNPTTAWTPASPTNVRAAGAANCSYNPATLTLSTGTTWTNTPAAGEMIYVRGSGNPCLDSVHQVASSTSSTIVLVEDGILSNAARIPSITAKDMTITRGQRVSNTLTPSIVAFGVEKWITRTSGTFKGVTASATTPRRDYSYFRGTVPLRLTLRGTGNQAITGTISTRASQELTTANGDDAYPSLNRLRGATVNDPPAAAETSGGSPVPLFNGVEYVKKCRFYYSAMSGGAAIEDNLHICPASFEVDLSDNLQVTPKMCAQPELEYTPGEIAAQVSLSGTYDTPFLQEAFNAQMSGVFEFVLADTVGNAYLVRFNRAKLQDANRDVTAAGQVIQANVVVRAFQRTDSPTVANYTPSLRAVDIFRFQAA